MIACVVYEDTSCPDNTKTKFSVTGKCIVDTSSEDSEEEQDRGVEEDEDSVFLEMEKKVREVSNTIRWHYKYKKEQVNPIQATEQEKEQMKADDPHYNPAVLREDYIYHPTYPVYQGIEVGSFYEEYGYQERLADEEVTPADEEEESAQEKSS